MSQDYTVDCYASGHSVNTDQANVEKNFECLRTMFSGTNQPSNMVAGMPWFFTTNKVLKQRNAANSAWIGLFHGDASQKILVYRNAAMDGYVVDSSITDRVVAIKGGSTYTTGGALTGSWTISGLSMAHTHYVPTPNHSHKWYQDPVHSSYDYGAKDGAGNYLVPGSFDFYSGHYGIRLVEGTTSDALDGNYYTDTKSLSCTSAAASTSTVSSSGVWRPAAAVFTIQYLNL